MFFDSHAHMTEERMFSDCESYLERAKAAGVERIINICTDKQTLKLGLELSAKHDWISSVGATTPHDVEPLGEQDFDCFAKAAREKKLVAVGETGLDYHYEHSPKKLQQLFLERYVELAIETKLPLVFHCREAFDDLFSITNNLMGQGQSKAVLHCFTGTKEEAFKAIDRGWMISMSGIVTFKRSVDLQEVAKAIPLEHLLIETDAPYLAPQSNRGKRNEPSFIGETAQMIASLKGVSLEEVAKATSDNGKAIFS